MCQCLATSATVVVQCQTNDQCTSNLKNEKDATAAVMIFNPLGDVMEPAQVGKGKSLQDQPPTQHILMSFIIWIAREANSTKFM